ncbi:MAG: hypothetical protein GY714_16105 [Desulfobacterales bacterium]|nr:hypothetical protein [Desulfobacterales bacterium]
MKKAFILASIFLIFYVTNYAFAEDAVTIKIGNDFSGIHKISSDVSSSNSDNVNSELSFSVEYTNSVSDFKLDGINFNLGAGINLQNPRQTKGGDGDFYFTSLYGLLKIGSLSEEKSPYLIGQVGYNFLSGDSDYTGDTTLKGGLYYGVGVGLILKYNFLVEALYSVNNGVAKSSSDTDVKYTKLSLSLGYNF